MFEILFLVLFSILFISVRRSGNRIARLEKELEQLKRLVASGGPPQARAEAASAINDQQEADWQGVAAESPPVDYAPEEEEQEVAAFSADAVAHETPADIPQQRESLESRLGARWAVWAGGLALAMGGIFLVRYSIESGLLGPGVRLTLATLFGLLLAGAGEAVRRKMLPDNAAVYSNAMIPGILTAAGTLTIFGTIYAAHAFYGFIGTTTAFVLLSLAAFATLGLSLLHGQALAGLGMFGSMVTPALVSSESANIPVLFGFLTLALVATALASRLRGWTLVPGLANLGMGIWALVYMIFTHDFAVQPPVLALLAMIATAIFVWPAGIPDNAEIDITVSRSSLLGLAARRPRFLNISVAIAAFIPAAFLVVDIAIPESAFAMVAIFGALSAFGASRHHAVWPALISAIGILTGISLMSGAHLVIIHSLLEPYSSTYINGDMNYDLYRGIALLAGIVFLVTGLSFIIRKGERDPVFAAVHATIAAIVPVWIAGISFLQYGNFVRDPTHGLYAIALATVLLAATEWLRNAEKLAAARNMLITGSFAALALALHALTSGLATTVGLSIIGAAYVMATRLRNWPALPWMMALASAGVLARIAWEPTIVGVQNLGTTPVFNALLPGYGIPAILAIASAWYLRNWPGQRVRYFLQAIASLMGLLTLAILVRHAMNGGVLHSNVPTLGEQSIYTLLTVGLSGVLMTLDLRSPSPVFRYGSMVAGVIAMINVATTHLLVLNPYFSGENTGPWPFFNLLLIGYLLPGLAYAGLAFYARGKRPLPYVTLLALCGSVMGFAWATLSVRRFWQGENIASWKGFMQGETYTYSVVWLAIGVALLALGSRFNARSLRLASAALVMISVAKVFLIDMSNLEGVLRALSFIGLGVVLIGIGLFYQKILSRQATSGNPASHESTG